MSTLYAKRRGTITLYYSSAVRPTHTRVRVLRSVRTDAGRGNIMRLGISLPVKYSARIVKKCYIIILRVRV